MPVVIHVARITYPNISPSLYITAVNPLQTIIPVLRHLSPELRPTDNCYNHSFREKSVTLQPSIECAQAIIGRKMHLLIYNTAM